ncbi:RluA family pseudouridine synthase [Patescibacteria group bacterium]|nr:RluA family pseudouridine synthase [Patescibacteria group bacterium]
MRIDKYLALKYENLSRSQCEKLINDACVFVNGKQAKKSLEVRETDKIEIRENEVLDVVGGDFDVPILYEDADLLVVDKPAGLVVHGNSEKDFSLVKVLWDKIKVSEFDDKIRPGIVHRLDKDTSGLLVVAKTRGAFEFLVDQFRNREVHKEYFALVLGGFAKTKGIIDAPVVRAVKNRKKMAVSAGIDSKNARTNYEVLGEYNYKGEVYSWLNVVIETGRTHQIRVHMAAISHPVVGDDSYGNKRINKMWKKSLGLSRQFLHAHKLRFLLPSTKKSLELNSDLSVDLNKVLKAISA